ncbi:MAG: holo-ACP synthase [Calditerrivibrio sp.]|nr:holo-ACP synthase [Calditerrivibrio sp.]
MLGCDIVEIDRIDSALKRFGDKFLNRILTEREKEIYNKRGGSLQFLSGRFAAKESISKSFKTGIGSQLSFRDIEILNGEKGEPIVFLKGIKREDIEVSISHGRDYSIAVSILKG